MKKIVCFFLLILIICPSAWAMKIGPVNTDSPGHISFMLDEYPDQITDKSYFQLFLDNQLVTIAKEAEFIGISGKAMSLVICADVSEPMKKEDFYKLGEALRFLFGIAADRKQDRLALVSFGGEVKVVSSFQATRGKLVHSTTKLQSGGTAQLDIALLTAMEQFAGSSLSERRRIIIVSTKKDFKNAKIPRKIVTKVKELNVSIDVLKPGKIDSEIEKTMHALSVSTGGQFIQVDFEKKSFKTGIANFYAELVSRRSLRIAFSYDADSDAGYAKEAAVNIALPGQALLSFDIKGRYALPKRKNLVKPDDGQKILPEPEEKIVAQKEPVKAIKKESWLKQNWIWLAIVSGLIMVFVAIAFYLRQKKEHKVLDDEELAQGGFEGSPVPYPPNTAPVSEKTLVDGYIYPEPSEDTPTAELVGIGGPLLGSCITINKDIFSIGCAQENDFCICDDADVSDHHAYLRYEQGSLFIFNPSKSSTFVNNTRVENTSRALEIGDKIKIGSSLFEIKERQTVQDDDEVGL